VQEYVTKFEKYVGPVQGLGENICWKFLWMGWKKMW